MALNKISARWAVNGSSIYAPTSSVITNDNIVSSDTGRTESGHMNITWVYLATLSESIVKTVWGQKRFLSAEWIHDLTITSYQKED